MGKEMFKIDLPDKLQFQINYLFITQCNQFNNNGALNRFQLNNSILNSIDNFSFIQTYVQLLNSEIFFNSSMNFKHIQLDRSMIYNLITQEGIYQTQFLITLSLNKVGKLKSKLLQNTNQITYEIEFVQSGQNYFYIPTGQKLTEYKRLNLLALQYSQVYNGLYIITQGLLLGQTGYKLQCHQIQFYNDLPIENINNLVNFSIVLGFNDISEYIFIVNPHYQNYTVFKIVCQSDINNQTIQLSYNVRAFPCQLGEYLYQNQCLECNVKQNQYSVKYNATKCGFIDQSILSAQKGLIKLQQQYWRYKYSSHIIEYCNSDNCKGGWIPGDKSCKSSRVGALCLECDLYNIRGEGYFTKNNDQCQLCLEFDIKFIIQLLCAIFLQVLIVLYGYYSNNKLSKQYLMFRVGFRQFYQILYRQTIDQPTIFIKIFINYLFMLNIIRSSLNLSGYIFVTNINVINNPGLIFQAQLDCLSSKLFKLEIIYSQYLFQILLVFFVLSLSYVIYIMIIQFKLTRHQLGFILYVTEGIIIYNIKIILDISCQLLFYTKASGQKWINLNKQYLFYSEKHVNMIYYIIPLSGIFLLAPLIFALAMKNLSIFNRQAKRIYAVYFQQFKNVLFFWEYLILYTKYSLIIFQIINNQYNITLIWLLMVVSQNYKPYYLQNLNQFEFNILAFYGIQLNVLIIMGVYKDIFIISCNLFIFIYFVKKLYNCHNLITIGKIIDWKKKLIQLMPNLRRHSGIDRNLNNQRNKIILKNLIFAQILKKNKILSFDQQKLLTETQIELSVMLNIQHTKTIYPSRFEPANQ